MSGDARRAAAILAPCRHAKLERLYGWAVRNIILSWALVALMNEKNVPKLELIRINCISCDISLSSPKLRLLILSQGGIQRQIRKTKHFEIQVIPVYAHLMKLPF